MEKLNFEQFKSDVHRTLISKLDLEKMAGVQNSKARQAVASLVQTIISDGKMPLSATEKEKCNPICWTRCSDWGLWKRCCAIRRCPTFW